MNKWWLNFGGATEIESQSSGAMLSGQSVATVGRHTLGRDSWEAFRARDKSPIPVIAISAQTDSQANWGGHSKRRSEIEADRYIYHRWRMAKKASRPCWSATNPNWGDRTLSRQKQVEATNQRHIPKGYTLYSFALFMVIRQGMCLFANALLDSHRTVRPSTASTTPFLPGESFALSAPLSSCSSNGFHSFGTLICVHITSIRVRSRSSSSMEVKVLKMQECKRKWPAHE